MNQFFLGGDFRYFWSENILDFASLPLAWDSSLNTGIGQNQLGSLWITSYLNFTAFFNKAGLSWEVISIIFWIGPAILISFLSSFFLFKYLFNGRFLYSILSGFLYTLNTYFLMILVGGQLGIALAYSLVPGVFLAFIKIIDKPNFKNSILAGIVLGLQILFDPRVVYISAVLIFIYLIFNLKLNYFKNKFFLLPFVISILINNFWILPLILTKASPVPKGFDSLEGFRFFSFSDFSHAISLLHPNFPENIFGKTYFLKPEFLLLPTLAYSSLLFINNKHKGKGVVLFFSLLGLIGAFLAKGTSEPFAFINEFLFENFPGMSMFRDPTKFYILIALSYSVLIPFSLFEISKRIKISNFKFQISNLFLLFTFLYLLFLIRPIFYQTQFLKPRSVPDEYVKLKDYLVSQPQFFRTLWIPSWQRFGFFSNNHPGVGREEILQGDAKKQIASLKKIDEEKLREWGIRYVIVPYDSEGEIFLDDRKYDEKKYLETIASLEKIPWLSEVSGFSKIRVFEINNPKDRFWSPERSRRTSLGINYQLINPSEYKVQVQNAKKGDVLVFSEGYDKNWVATSLASQGDPLQAQKFGNMNSFVLPKSGDYTLKVYYGPQKWVNTGLIVSFFTLLMLVLSPAIFAKKDKN